jgi:metal-responsive CopG/Arc/MetJ family transcriptional regulator
MNKQDTISITVSIPKELVEFLDRLAREWWVDRSGAVAELLEKERASRFELLMAEGYISMAAEDLRNAEEALNLTREVVMRDDQNSQAR